MSDERVERIAKVLCDTEFDDSGDYAWTVQDDAGMEVYRRQARAAIAAMDEEPTLEDVLGSDQRFAVMYVGIVQQGDDDWVALVDDARTKKRVEGVGSTIDAAIRAAVANAKEQG